MSRSQEVTGRVTTVLEPDVLVVGGGIQGLALVERLSRKRPEISTILLEDRELGGGQSGHSQAYLHQGFLYADLKQPNERFLGWFPRAKELWNEILADAPGELVEGTAFVGFTSPDSYRDHRDLWAQFDILRLLSVPNVETVPAAIQGFQHLFLSEEQAIDTQAFFEWLKQRHGDKLTQIVDSVFELDAANSLRVTAKLPSGKTFVVKPQATVFACGEANQEHMDRLYPGHGRQQNIKRGAMLVLHGPADLMPRVHGIFPDLDGAFLVSKRDADDPQKTYWLFSSNDPFSGDWQDQLEIWTKKAVQTLTVMSPSILARRNEVLWASYQRPLVRGPTGDEFTVPGGKCIRMAPSSFFVWPDRLTLAPLLAETLSEELLMNVVPRARLNLDVWSEIRSEQQVARPEWHHAARIDWDSFADNFGLIA